MALDPYTNTYTDIDSNIFDSDDLVNEFWRVAEYLNNWVDSYQSIGTTITNERNIDLSGHIVNITPASGILQKLTIDADVEEVVLNFKERNDGDPFRIFLSLRFRSKTTVFTVSGPAGQTHAFGINRAEYSPSQVLADGYYTAFVVATYGATNGLMLTVYADNQEATEVGLDDILTVVQK